MLPSVAWILKIETDSILIKEKRKQLSKTYDRVSKKMKRKRQISKMCSYAKRRLPSI